MNRIHFVRNGLILQKREQTDNPKTEEEEDDENTHTHTLGEENENDEETEKKVRFCNRRMVYQNASNDVCAMLQHEPQTHALMQSIVSFHILFRTMIIICQPW